MTDKAEERARESAAEWFDREVWAEGDGGERPDQSVETYPYKQGFLAGYREGEGQANPSPAAVARVLREPGELLLDVYKKPPTAPDYLELMDKIEAWLIREAMIPESEQTDQKGV